MLLDIQPRMIWPKLLRLRKLTTGTNIQGTRAQRDRRRLIMSIVSNCHKRIPLIHLFGRYSPSATDVSAPVLGSKHTAMSQMGKAPPQHRAYILMIKEQTGCKPYESHRKERHPLGQVSEDIVYSPESDFCCVVRPAQWLPSEVKGGDRLEPPSQKGKVLGVR